MNILFCGDENAEDGILISTLSLIKNSGAKELHLYILTMDAHSDEHKYHPFSMQAANYIRSLLTQANPNNTLQLIDCTELFKKQPPTVNMNTRFTPYAMLRLFASRLSVSLITSIPVYCFWICLRSKKLVFLPKCVRWCKPRRCSCQINQLSTN